jgi:hypothetical protein
MKRVFICSLFAITALAPTAVWADSSLAEQVAVNHVQLLAQNISKLDLINWKVGDKASYNVEVMGQALGTMDEYVDRYDGNNLWMVEKMNLMGQAQEVDTEIDRTNGNIIKMTVNGQDQQVPNDPPQITNQEVVDVTVPAGTFHCAHLTFNTSQVQGAQVWMNPQAIVMAGDAKEDMPTQGIEVVLELTSQAHGQ